MDEKQEKVKNAEKPRRRFFRPVKKPVKEGDVLKVKIEGKGKQGDGIAKVNGFVVFVKGDVEVGKEYEVKILRVSRKFSTAMLNL